MAGLLDGAASALEYTSRGEPSVVVYTVGIHLEHRNHPDRLEKRRCRYDVEEVETPISVITSGVTLLSVPGKS